jgi:hypothetical protein
VTMYTRSFILLVFHLSLTTSVAFAAETCDLELAHSADVRCATKSHTKDWTGTKAACHNAVDQMEICTITYQHTRLFVLLEQHQSKDFERWARAAENTADWQTAFTMSGAAIDSNYMIIQSAVADANDKHRAYETINALYKYRNHLPNAAEMRKREGD